MSNSEEIECLLSQLLVASKQTLSEAEQAEVQRFIDVGEYGLALETATDIYFEERKLANAEVQRLVERSAAAMSMDAAPLLKKLEG